VGALASGDVLAERRRTGDHTVLDDRMDRQQEVPLTALTRHRALDLNVLALKGAREQPEELRPDGLPHLGPVVQAVALDAAAVVEAPLRDRAHDRHGALAVNRPDLRPGLLD